MRVQTAPGESVLRPRGQERDDVGNLPAAAHPRDAGKGWRGEPVGTSAGCDASPRGPGAVKAYRRRIAVRRAGRVVMAGKFEVYKDAAGKFRFRLKASNGQVIATGEAYESRAAVLKGVASVQKNAPDAKVDDQTA